MVWVVGIMCAGVVLCGLVLWAVGPDKSDEEAGMKVRSFVVDVRGRRGRKEGHGHGEGRRKGGMLKPKRARKARGVDHDDRNDDHDDRNDDDDEKGVVVYEGVEMWDVETEGEGMEGGEAYVKGSGEKRGDGVVSGLYCGSPAIDGYAHVNLTCLRESPTFQQWAEETQEGKIKEGRRVWVEKGVSYDGIGVKWGPHNKKDSAYECALDCLNFVPDLNANQFPCNLFVYCPDDECFEPDAHTHTKGDCWLKFAERPHVPEINQRGTMYSAFRERHPDFDHTQWISGAVIGTEVGMTKGRWGPRSAW